MVNINTPSVFLLKMSNLKFIFKKMSRSTSRRII